ncbi:heme o synthase [Alpinimonas psychrophila]|uniref:Protoheme IX farnesyltransferase n=1 Tax=Alpinimonas psychrophila TaxID=748908 RepID=A0A7W3PNH7_9MICO|nr:heme o synthase [Alpinimonas psychrophila]MBA8828467.1 protoheme IX farnesyltransferase [Alpinimonas psychrophila]
MNVALDPRLGAQHIGFRRKAAAYLSLTKPRVMELLLAVTVPTMFLAQGGIPNLLLVLAVLIGGSMSAGAAGAFNCYIDRDIDRLMRRTKGRPLVTGELSDREAFVFAWTLAIVSTIWLAVFTNLLATLLSVGAIAFYVVIYTLLLKRRTPQNIVWGGAAGGFPVLIGWAAVTDSLTWAPVILFAIIFLWTPPHYWPLSWRYRQDYKDAGVPMLTVVRGRVTVGLQIVLYAWATLAATLLLIPVAQMGVLYSAVALVAGIWFVTESHRLYGRAIRHTDPSPMRLFHGSNAYLSIIFLVIAIDPLLPF